MQPNPTYAAFAAQRLIFRGPLIDLLAALKLGGHDASGELLLLFENQTGRQVDFDLRGSLEEVLARVQQSEAPRSPGRPRLGVEGRQITLLPRHWAWLERQPKGASATIRRLVDEASKSAGADGTAAQCRDATYTVMHALAGDLAGFEEASRTLFKGDITGFQAAVDPWPADIRDHLLWLHQGAGD